MSTDDKPERSGPGGRRTGQAVKSYNPAARAKANALIAILGQDYVDNTEALSDCVLAHEKTPSALPAGIPPELTALCWRMLRALKAGDAKWFEKRLTVRNGPTFPRLIARGRIVAIDPLRAALARLAQLQEDGRAEPMTLADVHRWLFEAAPTLRAVDDKTLRAACRDVGVRLIPGKRGRRKR